MLVEAAAGDPHPAGRGVGGASHLQGCRGCTWADGVEWWLQFPWLVAAIWGDVGAGSMVRCPVPSRRRSPITLLLSIASSLAVQPRPLG